MLQVTIGRSGPLKRGYYIEGDDPHSNGYIYGYATENETSIMCTT